TPSWTGCACSTPRAVRAEAPALPPSPRPAPGLKTTTMLRTALRNIVAHKARLIMTALAVVLGTAFVSGTLIFSDTVGQAYRTAMSKNLKDVAVSVQARSPLGSDGPESAGGPESQDGRPASVLTDRLADQIRTLPGVA